MEVFLQALVNGILLGGFYSLMGMGQNIIFGVMNIVNFCHGEMLMVGMYITYVLYTYFGVDPYVALPIVAVLMFGLGALIQSTLITPSLKTKSFTNLQAGKRIRLRQQAQLGQRYIARCQVDKIAHQGDERRLMLFPLCQRRRKTGAEQHAQI